VSDQSVASRASASTPSPEPHEPSISVSPVPKDTQLSLLVGLLAVTIMLATLVTLPDGSAPDRTLLSFIPHAKGLMSLHTQLRLVFALCTMFVLLMLLHIVTLRWRTSHALADLTREMQRISRSDPIPAGARAPSPSDPVLAEIADAFNRLLVHIGRQASLVEKRSSETRDYRQGFESVFADSAAPMCMVATDGNIVDANGAFCRLIGCSEDQFVETLWTDLLVLDDPAKASAMAARIFDPGNYLASTDATLKARDGSHVRCNIVTVVVHDSNGVPRYAIAHVTSVENIRKLEEALQRTQEQFRAAVAIKDRFIAVASFELRAPLTSAMLLIGSMERNLSLPAGALQDLRNLRQHLESETRLMDELLDVSAASDGTLRIEMTQTHVHDCLEVARSKTEQAILARNLALKFDLAADRDALVGDGGRLSEAFAGIIRCCAAMAANDATITVHTTNATLDSIRADIMVNDTAMNRAELIELLRPLAIGDCIQTARGSLDLAMARAIIEAHDGAITAQIDPTHPRAVFQVVLSVRTVSIDEVEAAPRPSLAVKGRGLHLLLIDDNHNILAALQRILSDDGHVTAGAKTAAEAIALAERRHFDLVICDICLPDQKGTELMPILRNRFGLHGIALSGLSGNADHAASRAAGFEAHFTKPIQVNALMDAIQRYARASVREGADKTINAHFAAGMPSQAEL